MSKKLITACLGLAVFAGFVMPAVASASPELGETKTPGVWTKLDPTTGQCTTIGGTICILATNVGNTRLKTDPASGGPVVLTECTKAKMTGYLRKNTGTEIEATIHTATFDGGGAGGKINEMEECQGSLFGGEMVPTTNGNNVDKENVEKGTPWCIRAINKLNPDEFQLSGGDCEGIKPITFILDTTFSSGVITQCKYERTEVIKGTFTTDTSGQDAVLSVTSKEGTTADTTFKGEAGNSILCPATGTLEMSFTLETDESPFEPIYVR